MRAEYRNLLNKIGLLAPAHRMRAWLKARGLWRWEPLVPETEFESSLTSALEILKQRGLAFEGDYVEFGVSRGTSMACAWRVFERSGLKPRLIGFDSFEGLGDDAAESGWTKGQFASTEKMTRKYLREQGVPDENLHLVKGWFSDTATQSTKDRLGLKRCAVLMVDADAYESSREAILFARDLISKGMIIIFDDWGWAEASGKIGQKEAFEEFLAANPNLKAEALPAYRPEARIFLLTSS